jgi:hypothetical protein
MFSYSRDVTEANRSVALLLSKILGAPVRPT